MRQFYVFIDEAGNFDFSNSPGRGASRYFILTSVTMSDCRVGQDLLDLRRTLAWESIDLQREFHATEDEQRVRDRVFRVLSDHDFRIDATVLEKRDAYPRLKDDPDRFYKFGLFVHLRNLAPQVVSERDELLVVGSSFGVRRKQELLHQAIKSVVGYAAPTAEFRTAFWPAATDPCLQVADYCCWAIQRKWERGDERSYVLIQDKIRSEVRPFHRALKGAG